VQVSKDPVGHKGARLTTQVSLAGRYLVYVPGRRRRASAASCPTPNASASRRSCARSSGRRRCHHPHRVGRREEEDIRGDVDRLQERWTEIDAKAKEITEKKAGAAALYEEPDVLVKVIRDLFNEDFSGLIVSGDNAWETINEYVSSVAPELVSKLTKYEPVSRRGCRVRMCSRCTASTSSWPRPWTARCGCPRAAPW
jgi:ribonuclease E